jgi:hypothetical protein
MVTILNVTMIASETLNTQTPGNSDIAYGRRSLKKSPRYMNFKFIFVIVTFSNIAKRANLYTNETETLISGFALKTCYLRSHCVLLAEPPEPGGPKNKTTSSLLTSDNTPPV